MLQKIKLLPLAALFVACAGSATKADAGSAPAAAEKFDFHKYEKDMLDKAEFHFMSDEGEITFVSYALIDIDHDGKPEVWVRGDDRENYQGVYSINPDGSVELLASSDKLTDLYFYPGGVGYDCYYDGGESEGFTIVKGSRPVEVATKYTQFDSLDPERDVTSETYTINGKEATAEAYDELARRLGQRYTPENVEWHTVNAD